MEGCGGSGHWAKRRVRLKVKPQFPVRRPWGIRIRLLRWMWLGVALSVSCVVPPPDVVVVRNGLICDQARVWIRMLA